jgi:hypothetical protein
VVANKEDACRMVPSPPRVVVISTLLGSASLVLVVYMGKSKCLCICAATLGSNMRETLS